MGSIREPATVLDSKFLGISEEFESRRVIEAIIIAALKQDNVCGIGVYGLDEADNSSLTKKIAEMVRGESSFNVVVTGSFGSASNEALSHLIVKEKMLMVLNDVPDILDIEKVGILLQMHKGLCKILMTSQFKGVFMAMGAHNIFAAQGLEKEVWIVCRDKIDYTSALPDLYGLARSIAQEYRSLRFAPRVVDRISRDLSKLRPKTLAERFLVPDLSYVSELQHKMVAQGLVHSYPKLSIQATAGSTGSNSQYDLNEKSFYSTSRQSTVTKEIERKKEKIDHETKPEVSTYAVAEKILNPDLSYISETHQQMVAQGSVHSCSKLSKQATASSTDADSQCDTKKKSLCLTSWKSIVTEENEREKEEIHHKTPEVSLDMVLHDKRYVRDCIVFCSVFPSDYVFTKDMLVWQWMAEGIISGEDEKMEEVYIQCFDVMMDLEYIVALGHDHVFDRMKYKFGDNLTTFLQKQLLEPKFQNHLDDEQTDVAKVEHFSLAFKKIDHINFGVLKKCSRLRTLILHRCYGSEAKCLPFDLFSELKALKILKLSHTNIDVLSSSIELLKELRYLDISGTPTRRLPEFMGCFSSLQSLILNQCLNIIELPDSMCKFTNLRHLVFNVCQLQSMPVGIGKLLELRTLTAFLVGEEDGRRIGELKGLNKLKGSLQILNLENVMTGEEAAEACLCDKHDLKKIELHWADPWDEKKSDEEEVLESLQPPLGIHDVKIISYNGGVLPSWLSNPLFSKLVSISLYWCRYCDSLPSLGELPSLKTLKIVGNDEVIEINSFFCKRQTDQHCVAFPKLEKLSFHSMSKLERWTGLTYGDFPSLRHLMVEYCPRLVMLPFWSYLNSLSQLEILYCPELSCLPEGGLPHTLKRLIMRGCPRLEERCQCEDWWKISHVPAIVVNGERVSL